MRKVLERTGGEGATAKTFPKPELTFVPVRLLEDSEFNPNIRTEAKNMEVLKADVLACNRVVSPILVVRSKTVPGHFDIGDGHRRAVVVRRISDRLRKEGRLEEAKALEMVPVAIYGDGISTADLYLRQFTSRRPSGAEAVMVWLHKPEAVPPRVRTLMAHVEALVGRERLAFYASGERVVKARKKVSGFQRPSTEAFMIGFKIADDLGFTDNLPKGLYPKSLDPNNPKHVAFARMLFDWLIVGEQRLNASRWLREGKSLSDLRRAIERNKPLNIAYRVGAGRAVPR